MENFKGFCGWKTTNQNALQKGRRLIQGDAEPTCGSNNSYICGAIDSH